MNIVDTVHAMAAYAASVTGNAPSPLCISCKENYQNLQQSYQLYNFVTELENSSWNVLCLLQSEEAYIKTGYTIP